MFYCVDILVTWVACIKTTSNNLALNGLAYNPFITMWPAEHGFYTLR